MGSVRAKGGVCAVFILALLAGACDGGSSPATPLATAAHSDVDGGYALLSTDVSQSSSSVSATIGSEGGTLSLNGHSLTVPEGALVEPLTFTLTTLAGTTVRVALSARTEEGEPVTAFAQPLLLSLSYAGSKVGNVNALKVAWLLDGSLVVQPTEVDRSAKVVRSWLYHFSDWGIAS